MLFVTLSAIRAYLNIHHHSQDHKRGIMMSQVDVLP
jgi:hypothetical protein